MATKQITYPKWQRALDGDDDQKPGDTKPGDTKPGDPKPGPQFTQEQLNAILAEERRKSQAQLEQLRKELNLTSEQNGAFSKHLEQLKLESSSEKEKLRAQYDADKKRLELELETTSAKAKTWQSLYEEETVQRALTDAAVATEALVPASVVALVRGSAELRPVLDDEGKETGKYKVQIQSTVLNAKTNKIEKILETPADAMKRMRESEDYAPLFKGGHRGGSGSGNPGQKRFGKVESMSDWEAQRKERGLK